MSFLVQGGEDRLIRVLEPLTYVDPEGVRYTVPKGFLSDGASIPPTLWIFVGSPLTGDYRRAAVVHDYGCTLKQEPSWLVHSRFYYAMRADGVGFFRAAGMYLAARYWGPAFDGTVAETSTMTAPARRAGNQH